MRHPHPKKRKIVSRSYKNFDEEAFSEAVGVIPFNVAYVFEDVDDIYWAHENLLTDILDEHAPVKGKSVRAKQCPFMNAKLRKASLKKAQLFNKYKQISYICELGSLLSTAKSDNETQTTICKNLLQ